MLSWQIQDERSDDLTAFRNRINPCQTWLFTASGRQILRRSLDCEKTRWPQVYSLMPEKGGTIHVILGRNYQGAMASLSAASKPIEQAENEHRGTSSKKRGAPGVFPALIFSPARRVSRLAKFPGRRGPAFPLPDSWFPAPIQPLLPDRRRFIHRLNENFNQHADNACSGPAAQPGGYQGRGERGDVIPLR